MLVESRTKLSDYEHGQPAHGATGYDEMSFLINRDGGWLYKGSLIKRKTMVCLFASMLTRDEDGQYLLVSPTETVRIKVDDAPFVVVDMKWRGVGRKQEVSFLTNTDECITAGQTHGLRLALALPRKDYVPYLHIRNGKGNFPIEARISRPTYYELVALAEPGVMNGREVMGVWSGGIFFPIDGLPLDSATAS